MGRWGGGLFQGDLDLDVVGDLDHEAGVDALEEAARTKIKLGCESLKDTETNGNGPKPDGENSSAPDTDGIGTKDHPAETLHYTVLADYCSDVGVVRDYMNEDNRLLKLVQTYEAKLLESPKHFDFPSAEYRLTILMACGMSLGCTFPDEYLFSLKTLFRHLGLQDEGVEQLGKALNGPDGFKNDGSPYDFCSKGLIETANAMAADL